MRAMRFIFGSTALVLPLVLACGSDGSGAAEEEGGETAGEVGSAEGASSDGEGDTGNPPPSSNAKGLSIAGVTANQGVAIPIASGTSWVGGAERNARLVERRDTLIRAYFNLDDGWVPRDIECRLRLEFGDGTSTELVNVMSTVSASSQQNQLNSTCNFYLDDEAGHTAAGTKFQVGFYETSEGAGAGLSEHPNLAPAEAAQDVGFEAGDMVMKVKLVPVLYQNQTAPLEANLDLLRDQMFQQNPLNRIDISVREPVPSSSADLYQLLNLMEQTKAQDGAPNNEYYFAFVNTGQQWGTIGLAPLGGTVAAGLWLQSPQMNTETFVHEVGHDQNMGHVECPDFGMPPFETYPYPNGFVGVTGFGIINNQLYPAFENYNYMTYCGQGGGQWASDWNWGAVWGRIQQFTAQGDAMPRQPVLRGMVGGSADGELVESWWTTRGEVDSELLSGNELFTFRQGEDFEVQVLGEVRTLSDSTSLWITVALPEGFDPARGHITRTSLGQEHALELRSDALYHTLTTQ